MIRPLRKYHFMIWRLGAFLLPIAFGLALVVRPTLPLAKREGPKAITAEIGDDTDSTSVVTVTVGSDIKAPSCVAILSSPSKDIMLGALNHKGQFIFKVPKVEGDAILNLLDAIHQRKIASIPLTKVNNPQ